MKKRIFVALIVLMFAVSFTATAAEGLMGDANGDSEINSIDAATVLKYDAALISDVSPLADVNGDGAVNSIDAALILKYDAGIINDFITPETSGYAKLTVTVDGKSFALGETLGKLLDKGFFCFDWQQGYVLEPMEHVKVYINEDPTNYSYVSVINFGATAANIEDCVVYNAYLHDEMLPEIYGFDAAVQGFDQLEAVFGQADRVNEWISFKDIVYGSYLNNLAFVGNDPDVNTIENVELSWFEWIIESDIDTDAVEAAGGYVYECMLLAPYMDVSPYCNEYSLNEDYEAKAVDALIATVEGVEVVFGVGGDGIESLEAKGIPMPKIHGYELDEEADCRVGYVVENAPVNDRNLTAFTLVTPVESNVTFRECVLGGIDLYNRNYIDTYNDNAVDFNFFGITQDSSVEDVIDALGMPQMIDVYDPESFNAELIYVIETENDTFEVEITVDTITNQVVSIIV